VNKIRRVCYGLIYVEFAQPNISANISMHHLKEFYESSRFIYMQDEQAFDFLNCLPADVMPPARIVELFLNLSTVQTYLYVLLCFSASFYLQKCNKGRQICANQEQN